MNEALLSISLTGCGKLVKMLITLEPHSIFGSNFAYLFIFTFSRHWYAKRWRGFVSVDRGHLVKMLINKSWTAWYILIKLYLPIQFNIVEKLVCKMFSDLYRLVLYGIYILAEALQNFIRADDASTIAIQTKASLEKFNHLIKKTNTLNFSIRHMKSQLILQTETCIARPSVHGH